MGIVHPGFVEHGGLSKKQGGPHRYPLVNQHSYGKSPLFMGNSALNGNFQ
jgi:hypothetical protein